MLWKISLRNVRIVKARFVLLVSTILLKMSVYGIFFVAVEKYGLDCVCVRDFAHVVWFNGDFQFG